MVKFNSLSIRHKLVAIIVMVCTLALLLSTAINLLYQWKLMTHETIKKLEVNAEVISLQSRAALEFMDPKAAKENLESLSLDPSIEQACLYDEQKHLFATYISLGLKGKSTDCSLPEIYGTQLHYDSLELYSGIRTEDNARIVGSLYLKYDLNNMHVQLFKIAFVKFSVMLLVLALVWPLSVYFQRIISQPIVDLSAAARSFSKDLTHPIHARKFNDDEIGGLVDTFNGMMREIFDNEQELGKVISELRLAKENAESANKSKSEFLANMSHEIRTPLNAVIGLAYVLSNTPLTERQKEFVDTLRISGSSLLSLINDLLDFARLEDGSVVLEHVEFNLVQTVQNVLNIMGVRASEKKLQLLMDSSQLHYPYYMGDPLRIQQIITNLVSNAVKFTASGYVRISLSGLTNAENGAPEIRIDVSDSGIGIAPEKLTTIFDKFTQADASITRKYGGTGLGLAITKSLVAYMKGRIEVKSEQHKGSIFTVLLPLEHGSVHQVLQPQKAGYDLAPGQDSLAALENTVLLVEDYPPNILVASAILEHLGYHYEVAHNGMEAIVKFQERKYTLILMDIQLPGMDGMEITRRIRAIEHRKAQKKTPIIAVTAFAMIGDKEKFLQAGMDDYLTKPFIPDDLKNKMDALLGK